MPSDSRLSLRRSRRTGVLVCVLSLAGAAAFAWGIHLRSFWALAIPVGLGVFWVLGLAFWVGYTINTVRGIPPEADQYQGRKARAIAALICLGSLAGGLAFLYGLAARSYWALAVPVSAAVLGLLSMVFWIGWAIVSQRTTLAADEAAGPEELGDGAELPVDARP